MIEIMQMIHHHPNREERDEKREFDKPFKQRLSEELEHAESEYIANQIDFVINLSTDNILFQIISNKMLEANRVPESGFGLHLSFDEVSSISMEERAKFERKDYSKVFDYYYLDEVPTYQIDLGMDKKRLVKLVNKILIEVYEEALEAIKTDNFTT